jgi:hypothetical protein
MNKVVTGVISAMSGAVLGAGFTGKVAYRKTKDLDEKAERYLTLFRMMDKWVEIKQGGKNLSLYFQKREYTRIAIYGMSRAGKTLYNELEGTGITVAYGIDKSAETMYADVDILGLDDSLEPVDAVVVTAVTYFQEIKKDISEKVHCPVISLEDILYEV